MIRIALLGVLLLGCQSSLRLSDAPMDAYHRECQSRIEGGFTVTRGLSIQEKT